MSAKREIDGQHIHHMKETDEQQLFYRNMNYLLSVFWGTVHVLAFIVFCIFLYIGIPLLYDWLKSIF